MSPRLNPLVHIVSHKSTPLILGPRPPAPLVLDTTVGVVAGPVLKDGTTYHVTVVGTSIDWNRGPLTVGHPEPTAMYPTTGGNARKSTEVGQDAETVFASDALGYKIGPRPQVLIATAGSYVHVVPEGGPYETPSPGHSYTYVVVGAGEPVSFRWHDSVLNDNFGAYHIAIA